MSRGIRLLVVVIAIILLSGVFAAWAAAQTGQPQTQPPVRPRSSGSSPKTHVIEVFTGTWCPPCAVADPALSRLADEFSDYVVLFYHCCEGGASPYDPFWSANTYPIRWGFYRNDNSGGYVLPTVFFDGGGAYSDGSLVSVGNLGSEVLNYNDYAQKLTGVADTTSNMIVNLRGDLTPTMADVTASVTATDSVTQLNLFVRMVLYEEPLYYPGTNGISYQRYLAREVISQPLTIAQGQTVDVSASFAINPMWNLNKLGVAAFVQSGTRTSVTAGGVQYTISDILNADRYDFAPRGILIYRDRGTAADYAEVYEELVSTRNDYLLKTWNSYTSGTDTGTVDDRSLPTAAELAEFPLVIWHTGPTSSGVLSVTERDLLSGHLDAGGNLFITGSNIGFDAWTGGSAYRTWFQQYLHAIFNGDDTGMSTVTGVAGDPISDAFSAQNLNILASPDTPDRINAVTELNSAVPFRYNPTDPGSVRSQHDADSRMVYFGFQYFEGSDFWRAGVMGKVIEWIDGAAAPQVDVQYPDGGEQFAQGAPVTIRWHANDVVMPEDAIDLYFSDNGGANWQLIATNEPNDGRYAWTVPNIDSAQCRIRVVARDLSLESPNGVDMSASNFVCGDPGFRLTFTSSDLGWRLISFPTILSDTTTPAVLSSMAGNFRIVRAFNPASADPWMAYDPSRTGGDLQYIDNTMAFWIEVTQPGVLNLQGSKPTSTQYVPLRAGWNLVGFPSYQTAYTVAMLKTATGATRVEGFDATNVEYRLRVMTNVEPLITGQGYWVFVPTDTVWQVPA